MQQMQGLWTLCKECKQPKTTPPSWRPPPWQERPPRDAIKNAQPQPWQQHNPRKEMMGKHPTPAGEASQIKEKNKNTDATDQAEVEPAQQEAQGSQAQGDKTQGKAKGLNRTPHQVWRQRNLSELEPTQQSQRPRPKGKRAKSCKHPTKKITPTTFFPHPPLLLCLRSWTTRQL